MLLHYEMHVLLFLLDIRRTKSYFSDLRSPPLASRESQVITMWMCVHVFCRELSSLRWYAMKNRNNQVTPFLSANYKIQQKCAYTGMHELTITQCTMVKHKGPSAWRFCPPHWCCPFFSPFSCNTLLLYFNISKHWGWGSVIWGLGIRSGQAFIPILPSGGRHCVAQSGCLRDSISIHFFSISTWSADTVTVWCETGMVGLHTCALDSPV